MSKPEPVFEFCKPCADAPDGICSKHEQQFRKTRLATPVPPTGSVITPHDTKHNFAGIPKCNRCGLNGPSPVRIESLCETCFIEIYIAPATKELERAEALVSSLASAQFEQMRRLHEAQQVQLSKPIRPYKCHKCGNYSADQMFKLIWHENDCKGTGKKVSSPRPRRLVTAAELEGDDFV
jgi:ribosomal protein L37AE/L43A